MLFCPSFTVQSMKVGMAWMKDQSIKKKKKHLKPLMLICLQDSNITRDP
jgi:hypothetical protein